MPLKWTSQEREYGFVFNAQIDTPIPNLDYLDFTILNDTRTNINHLQLTFRDRWNASRSIVFEFEKLSDAQEFAETFAKHLKLIRTISG